MLFRSEHEAWRDVRRYQDELWRERRDNAVLRTAEEALTQAEEAARERLAREEAFDISTESTLYCIVSL